MTRAAEKAARRDKWNARPEDFGRLTKYGATVAVADLQGPASNGLRDFIKNADALRAFDSGKKLGYRFAVLAGQLHREAGGAFAVLLPGDDLEALALAALAAYEKMTALGETYSAWAFLCDEKTEEHVAQALAAVQPTQGQA